MSWSTTSAKATPKKLAELRRSTSTKPWPAQREQGRDAQSFYVALEELRYGGELSDQEITAFLQVGTATASVVTLVATRLEPIVSRNMALQVTAIMQDSRDFNDAIFTAAVH